MTSQATMQGLLPSNAPTQTLLAEQTSVHARRDFDVGVKSTQDPAGPGPATTATPAMRAALPTSRRRRRRRRYPPPGPQGPGSTSTRAAGARRRTLG